MLQKLQKSNEDLLYCIEDGCLYERDEGTIYQNKGTQ
jgi:hypothetical protein